MKKLAVVIVALAIWAMPAVIVYAASNRDNDVVFNQKDYTEYFKKEGSNKNYLYTRTTQDAPPPGKCYVFTGDSEKTMVAVCNTNPS